MSAFGGLILTNRGRILQSKAQAGVPLQYTRMAIGDGELGTSSILNLYALRHEVKSINLTKLKILGDGIAVVGAVLSNQDLLTGFYFREIGIFATDPDVGEILYCYGNSGALAEYIPAGGSDIIEKNIDVQTVVGNATNVTANIDSSLVYETQEGASEKANQAKIDAIGFAKGFGLGDLAKDISGTDINELSQTGWYAGNNLINSPDGSTGFFMVNHIQLDLSTNFMQIAAKYGTTSFGMLVRVSASGSWTPWEPLALTKNVVPYTGTTQDLDMNKRNIANVNYLKFCDNNNDGINYQWFKSSIDGKLKLGAYNAADGTLRKIIAEITSDGVLTLGGQSYVDVYKSSSQSIVSSTNVKITGLIKSVDRLDEFAADTITIVEQGIYAIYCYVDWDSFTANRISVRVYLNDSYAFTLEEHSTPTAMTSSSIGTVIRNFLAGDKIEFYVTQNNGSTFNITSARFRILKLA